MGLLKAMHRRSWKNAVSAEFFRRHGVHLRSLVDVIEPATLDDLLNKEYDCTRSSPVVAVANVTRVLSRSFGINIPLIAMRSKIDALGWDREAS